MSITRIRGKEFTTLASCRHDQLMTWADIKAALEGLTPLQLAQPAFLHKVPSDYPSTNPSTIAIQAIGTVKIGELDVPRLAGRS